MISIISNEQSSSSVSDIIRDDFNLRSSPMKPKHRYWFSYRFLIIILGLYSYVIFQMTAMGFGFAIVCMVPEETDISSNLSDALHWTRTEQSVVLSALQWGGVPLIIPSGLILDRYGCKRMMLICYTLLCIGNWLQPTIATFMGPWAFAGVRFFMGIISCVQIPAIMKIVEGWVPQKELGVSLGLAYCGSGMGSLILYFVSGFICSSSLGWPYIFYFIGALMVIFLLFWAIFFTDAAESNRFISEDELNYIERTRDLRKKSTNAQRRALNVPWKAVLTSKPILAGIIGNAFQSLLAAFFSFYVPQYLRDVLRLDVESNGVFSAMPFLAQMIFRFCGGFASDKIQKRYGATFGVKLFHFLCQFLPIIILVAVTFIPTDQKLLTIGLLILMSGLFSLNVGAHFKSYSLNSGPFSGSVVSLNVLFGFVVIALSPYCINALIPDRTVHQWHVALYIIAGFGAISWVTFQVFGSGELQPWADINKLNSEKSNVTLNENIFTVDSKAQIISREEITRSPL